MLIYFLILFFKIFFVSLYEVEIAIQINGKIKARINIASDATEELIKETYLNSPEIKAALEGKTLVKVIVIKGRLVNIVIK